VRGWSTKSRLPAIPEAVFQKDDDDDDDERPPNNTTRSISAPKPYIHALLSFNALETNPATPGILGILGAPLLAMCVLPLLFLM
jgi:hypothetical protein